MYLIPRERKGEAKKRMYTFHFQIGAQGGEKRRGRGEEVPILLTGGNHG